METTASGNTVILPFIRENSLVFRALNVEGIHPGDSEPDPQTIALTSTRKILNAVVISFLSDEDPLKDSGSTVTVHVEDHCLVVLEVEPVSILCNEYNLPATRE